VTNCNDSKQQFVILLSFQGCGGFNARMGTAMDGVCRGLVGMSWSRVTEDPSGHTDIVVIPVHYIHQQRK
jgi:hypothetical protein